MSFTSLNLNNCEANLHTKINETDTGAVETSMYPTDHSKKKKKKTTRKQNVALRADLATDI